LCIAALAVSVEHRLVEETMAKREHLEMQQRFLIQRLKDWRSPAEVVEISDLLHEIARKIANS
jgi:hypothetical protein